MHLSYTSHWIHAPSRHASRHLREMQASATMLASGSRAVSASVDMRATTVGTGIESRLVSSARALDNATTGRVMLTVADAAYEQVTGAVLRMRDLAMMAATDTVTDEQRSHLQVEFASLASQIDDISEKTEYNGIPLLNAAQTFHYQVGVYSDPDDQLSVDLPEVSTTSTVNVAGATIGTGADAQDALDTLDTALENINEERSHIGASMNRLQLAEDAAWAAVQGYARAKGETVDLDFAEKASAFALQQIRLDAATAMTVQARSISQVSLRLIA